MVTDRLQARAATIPQYPGSKMVRRMDGPAHVLVVDDEPIVRDVVSRYLVRSGFSVGSAADGEAALEAFEQEAPDLVLLDLGLVVETDSLRYHRTPAKQARDRLRDQVHTAAGLTPLRFTHAQIRFERAHVTRTLVAVARRLAAERAPAG